MVILGIDPGIATVGYGAVEFSEGKFSYLDCGAVVTPAGERVEKRLYEIFVSVRSLIKKFSPDAIAIEELFFNSNQKTVINVAQARGVILLAAEAAEIPLFEYTPLQVKSAVVGYGRAEKRQVMELTRSILSLSALPKPDDAADALALAVCHAHSSGSKLGRLSQLEKSRKTGGK